MNLESLICKQFRESVRLCEQLAKFNEAPAVFSPAPPKENQEGWESNVHYPRLIFNMDMKTNEERKSVGTLLVSLICQNTVDVVPEIIEREIKKCLCDVLLKPEGNTLYTVSWAKTDGCKIQEKDKDLLIGSDLRFDIFEYTNQETTDPDPVVATNHYIKELYPEAIIIGLDRMEDVTEATQAVPVIYCRLITIDKGIETNTVAWMDGKIAVHVLCPDNGKRIKMAAAIANQLSLAGEIPMMDDSPMSIKRLQVNYKSDYLKDGQIFVTVHYGLLKYRQKKHRISGAEIKNNFS